MMYFNCHLFVSMTSKVQNAAYANYSFQFLCYFQTISTNNNEWKKWYLAYRIKQKCNVFQFTEYSSWFYQDNNYDKITSQRRRFMVYVQT